MTREWAWGLAVVLVLGAALGLSRVVIGADATRAHLLLGARLAGRPGPLQATSPRLKLVVLAGFAVAAALTDLRRLPVAYLLLGGLLWVSRVPWRLLAERFAELLPFVLLAAAGTLVAGDVERFALVLARAGVTVGGIVLVISTTPWPDLLRAARRLRLPAPLVAVVGLALRYLVVVLDEGHRLGLAWHARAVGPRDLRQARPLGRLVGALACRSLERSERIHRAMLARGFTGELPGPEAPDRLGLLPALVALALMTGVALAAGVPR